MIEREAIIKSKYGIHARPSAVIFEKSKEYPDTYVYIINPDTNEKHNTKSILDIMSINKKGGEKVLVRTFGKDEERASEEIVNIIETFEVNDINK